MTIDLSTLFLVGVGYLSILFLIAHATDVGVIPESWVKHPLVYVLSLGVYATSWTFYGSVGFAQTQGFNFLPIYLGATLAFLISPILLMPILRLTREYQLTSLADLFAFRYRSQWAGVLVTLFMLVGTLPYIALQIRAVTGSARVLSQEAPPHILALAFCVTLIAFAILFGARHTSPRDKHLGLVMAIAFESLIKLIALISVGLFAIFGVFGGLGELNQWVRENPGIIDLMYEPVREGPWTTLILLAFSAAFLLPRQFHMTFTENLSPSALRVASWGFPTYLLLLNIFIPVILWAGNRVVPEMSADFFVLGLTLGSDFTLMPLFVFIGGLSAASAMMIVTTLALSSMCLNHLILPTSYPSPRVNIYRWLLWARRALIALIIMAGYAFFTLLEHNQGLVSLGLISFVAVAQFIPGIVGVIYWRQATRVGFILGLCGGALVWFLVLIVPMFEQAGIMNTNYRELIADEISGSHRWAFATFWTLAANVVLFVLGSLLSKQSEEEREASRACCSEAMGSSRRVVAANSPVDFKLSLGRVLGSQTAKREVEQALADLHMSEHESKPAELARLRERLERNLSGLIGPQLAYMIINQRLEFDPAAQTALVDTMRHVEERLERSRDQLRGLDAELDALRRFHRQILLDLPVGVCAVSADHHIITWNLAMEVMSGVPANQAMGQRINDLPHPWADLLDGFLEHGNQHMYRLETVVHDTSRWFNLHKASIAAPQLLAPRLSGPETGAGVAMLLEEVTEVQILEAELAHTERLASVGRLAAGVAHEIGNPVTGIASVAQNLRDEDDEEVIRESVEMIIHQTKRITDIVRSLMTFSHHGSPQVTGTPFDLCAMLDEAVQLIQLSHEGKQINFKVDCPGERTIKGDEQRLLQVMVNALSNASDASEAGSDVDISVRPQTGGLTIDVSDHGHGIAAKDLERIFEPFFTTKEPGHGTGLGLSLVYRIIQDHGGDIRIDSDVGRGTTVSIYLPDEPPANTTTEMSPA